MNTSTVVLGFKPFQLNIFAILFFMYLNISYIKLFFPE